MRLGVLLIAITCAGWTQSRETNPFQSEKDVAEGRRLYSFYCVFCHGMDGASGRGARLATTFRRHGSSDQDQFRVILNGVSGTEMSGHWLEEDDIWKILAFVRTLERSATASAEGCDPAGGDAVRGRALFFGKGGCLKCHSATIDGRPQGSGRLGPDLTYMGATRTRRHLRESLLDPDKDIARQYRQVRIVTGSGETQRGLILNEDEYTVHIMNPSERILSFRKADLNKLEPLTSSFMPSYRQALSAQQLEDLLSFTCALRGGGK
ncbi:MAG: c-type cytochrome [Bryobacteraceae bacterium]|nr:c-type cytochrome [Bryobacteraceae bacterium]